MASTLCEKFLINLGYEVKPVDDAERARGAFAAEKFQLVISDWNLPGKSGIEFCRELRALKRNDYTYFILITMFQGNDKLTEAMDSGVDDFLTKPLDFSALSVRLRVAGRILDFHRQIGTLKGLLPICMYCKKIRNDGAFWEHVESYITAHTGADFTHSLCPTCYQEKVIPQLEELRGEAQGGF